MIVAFVRFVWPAVLLLTLQCAAPKIPGTMLDDTPQVRAVLEVLAALEVAMAERDLNKVLPLISPSFFDASGSADPKDDYSYKELREQRLPTLFRVLDQLYLRFVIHDITVKGNKATAEVRYEVRGHLNMESGGIWDSHKDFQRIHFQLEQGQWRIVSGL